MEPTIDPDRSSRWLLLHGTPLTAAIWKPVAEHLRGGVVAPDVTPTAADQGSQRSIAQRVVAGLPPQDRWRVVGHSFGGQIALEIALLLPNRVQDLTILCSRDTPYPAFTSVAAAIRSDQSVDVDAALSRWFRPEELNADSRTVLEVRQMLQTADREAWAAALDAIAAYERSSEVAAITVPTRVVATEFDTVSTPGAMAAMAARMPHGQFVEIHNAGHMSPFLHPDRLADLIQRHG